MSANPWKGSCAHAEGQLKTFPRTTHALVEAGMRTQERAREWTGEMGGQKSMSPLVPLHLGTRGRKYRSDFLKLR